MDYINLDIIDKISDNYTLIKDTKKEIFQENAEIYKSSDGVVLAKDIEKKPISNPKDVKVYKLYEVQQDDTLQKLVRRFLEEYPITKRYYTESQLCNEIVNTNGLRNNSNNLSGINFLTIPSYLPIEKQEEEELPDYEEHFVTINEQNYYQIVLNLGYTSDSDEIQEIAAKMQEINGNTKPVVFSNIKVPCVKKYKMEHSGKKR